VSYIVCKICNGMGFIADQKSCEVCDGNGILIRQSEEVKEVEYRPERQVRSVSMATLNLWREELEGEIDKVQKNIMRLKGGLLQIDREIYRRQVGRIGESVEMKGEAQ
jgi:RecJ-like exonuclease